MPLGYPAAFSGMGPADITFSITSRPAVSIGDVASVRPLVRFLRHRDGPRRGLSQAMPLTAQATTEVSLPTPPPPSPPPPVIVTSVRWETIKVKVGNGKRARTKSETALEIQFSGLVAGTGETVELSAGAAPPTGKPSSWRYSSEALPFGTQTPTPPSSRNRRADTPRPASGPSSLRLPGDWELKHSSGIPDEPI